MDDWFSVITAGSELPANAVQQLHDIGPLLGIAPVPILAAVFLWKRRQLRADTETQTVETVEGSLRKQVFRSTRGGVAYLLHVGGRRLQVGRDLFALFEDGNAYRLYVTPASKTVVGAEAVD